MRTFTRNDTKKDIIAAYHQLEKEYDAVLEKLAQFAPPEDVPGESANAADISQLALTLQSLRGNLRHAVGGYQNAVANELLQLKELNNQLTSEATELKTLHNIELNGGSTVPNLVARYEEQLALNKKAEQEAIAAAKRASEARDEAWAQEQKERQQFVAQREEDFVLDLQRDQEEYDYAQQRQRENDADTDAQTEKQFEAELLKLKTDQQTKWKDRDSELFQRELACKKLRDEAARLKEDIEKAVSVAKAQGEGIAKRNAAMAARMVTTAHKTQLNQRDIELKSLQSDQADNNQTLRELQTQLERITKDNLTLSQGALNSADRGAMQALAAVKEVAIAQTQSSGKR